MSRKPITLQRRLADYHFERATSWEEAKAIHERWMNDHNFQDHWAHRNREDGKTSPAQVLGWGRGCIYAERRVQRVFCSRQLQRAIHRLGYIRFRHWRMYAEEGLAGKAAPIWRYGETLPGEHLGICAETWYARKQAHGELRGVNDHDLLSLYISRHDRRSGAEWR
jgi:hypothetical protein